MSEETKCAHTKGHVVNAEIAHIEDTGRFMLHLRVLCMDCGHPFRVIAENGGCPVGLNLNGVAVSPDFEELRVGIAPVGEPIPPSPFNGFSITIHSKEEETIEQCKAACTAYLSDTGQGSVCGLVKRDRGKGEPPITPGSSGAMV